MTGVQVSVRGVVCRLEGLLALDDVSLGVPAGTLLGLVGPNGAGKTTLLRAIAGLVRLERGDVRLDGVDPHRTPAPVLARLVATLSQHPVIPAGVTAREAVAWGRFPHLSRLERPGADDLRMVDESLAKTEIGPLADRLVTSLSGGERQRVLLARALAQAPRLLLLDEPTVHLDAAHQTGIMRTLQALARDGLTVIAALHDLMLAAACCDRVAVLSRGRLLACGTPQEAMTEDVVRRAYGEGVRAVAVEPGWRV